PSMSIPPRVSVKLAVALGVALLIPALALSARGSSQESKAETQSIDLGGLTIEVPASWKRLRPTSSMRKAEVEIPVAEGDTTPGNLAVFVFPQGAGTVQANVQRWQQQFKDEDGQTPDVA